jgi:hypothetical protein
MSIQRRTVELRQNIDFINFRINAVRNWDVYQSILPSQWDSWLGTHFCQWIEACTSPSAENDG